jgi:hypothetical protein
MGLIKITFDGASVSAKQDADINYHLFNLVPAGIIEGLGSEISYSFASNKITFQSGYLSIYGRRIFVENNTQISVALDTTKYCYVVVTLSIPNNSITLEKLESTSGYPTLTQNNLYTTNGVYQFALCRYSKTPTSITLDTTYERPKLKTISNLINEKYQVFSEYVDSNYGVVNITPTSTSGGIFRFNIGNLVMNKCLFACRLYGNRVTVFFTGIEATSASIKTINYLYLGTTYNLIIEYTSTQIYLYSSNSLHYVSGVQAWR